jgi:hypothetical protein
MLGNKNALTPAFRSTSRTRMTVLTLLSRIMGPLGTNEVPFFSDFIQLSYIRKVNLLFRGNRVLRPGQSLHGLHVGGFCPCPLIVDQFPPGVFRHLSGFHDAEKIAIGQSSRNVDVGRRIKLQLIPRLR